MFIELPDLHLIHYGKKEVLALTSLLKPEWDQPMVFGDNLGDKDTTPAATRDPSQRWGVVSTMPKMNVPCRTMMTKGMVFRYMWVYSKEDTMAHTRRPVVTS